MRRIGTRTTEEALDYHRGRDDAPEFEVGHPGRIDLARFFIDKILVKDITRRPCRIVELGCGAGDVSGPYSLGQTLVTHRGVIDTRGIEVIGYDVVPEAGRKVARRYPDMKFTLGAVEDMEPIECDILVMTEFLEHVITPVEIIEAWGPLAKWMVIGHPLDEPDPPYEYGHNWSYEEVDWAKWYAVAGHRPFEKVLFPMGYWDHMVIGHGARGDQPAWQGIHPDG